MRALRLWDRLSNECSRAKSDRSTRTAPDEVKPAGAIPAPGGSAISVLRSLRRHKFVAFLVVMLVIAAGLPLAWIKGTPRYATTAVIFVSPHFVANLQDGKEIDPKSDSQYHEYIQENARTINRFDIVTEALRKLGSRKSVWVEPNETMDHAAERLQGALEIQPVPDTYQITVTLESKRRDGIADLVNAVTTTFIERAKSEEFYASDERVRNLTLDRSRIEQEIRDKQARRLEIAQELGVSSFTENFVNPYDRLLVKRKKRSPSRAVRISKLWRRLPRSTKSSARVARMRCAPWPKRRPPATLRSPVLKPTKAPGARSC